MRKVPSKDPDVQLFCSPRSFRMIYSDIFYLQSSSINLKLEKN